MEEGFVDTSDSELEKLWLDKDNPKYSKEFVESVHQEILNRGIKFSNNGVQGSFVSPTWNKQSKKIPLKYTILGLVLLVAYTVFIVFGEIVTGHTTIGKFASPVIYRDKDPIEYWLLISFYILVAIGGFYQLINNYLNSKDS